MEKGEKDLIDLLDRAELEDALSEAEGMKDSKIASEILSDYAAALARNLNEYDAAEKLLKKAVLLNPKDALAFYNLGVLYTEPALLARDENKLADAEKAYKKAIKLNPDYLEAHYNLALLYHFSGRSDEAELEQAVFSELCEDAEISAGLKKILNKKLRKINFEDYIED